MPRRAKKDPRFKKMPCSQRRAQIKVARVPNWVLVDEWRIYDPDLKVRLISFLIVPG